MKIDVTQTLNGLDGKPLKNEDGTDATVRSICIAGLMAVLDEDRGQSGEDKLKTWTLAKRLQDEDAPDLAVEDLAKLKERVGKCFGPVVVGPVFLVLDGAT